MVPIIVLSILIVVLFVVIAGLLIKLVINLVKKTSFNVNRLVITLCSLFVLLIVLGCVNAYYIVSYLYKNREVIIDKGTDVGSQILTKSVMKTAKGIEKDWDQDLVKRLGNIEVSLVKSSMDKDNLNKNYRVELLFNNHNQQSETTSLDMILSKNYLTACDKDDIIYGIRVVKSETSYLPTGKTKAEFEVTVPKETGIEYIRFLTNRIYIKG